MWDVSFDKADTTGDDSLLQVYEKDFDSLIEVMHIYLCTCTYICFSGQLEESKIKRNISMEKMLLLADSTTETILKAQIVKMLGRDPL